MTKQEANAIIADKLKAVRKLFNEIELISEKESIEIDFSLGYGMGGTYVPESMRDKYGNLDDYCESGWVSSSSQC